MKILKTLLNVDNDVKVRDHCHITGKYKAFGHRDFNSNIKLTHKTSVLFYNLKNYDSYLTMQELGKFSLKINLVPNGLEKYMSFIINNKLSFVDSSPFPSSSLNSLVKKLSKHDFKNLSQKFVNNVLDLVKQNGFYPYEYMNDFEKFKKKFRSKKKIYSSLTGRKASDKEHQHVHNI